MNLLITQFSPAPVISALSDPNIFSNTISLFSSLSVRDHVLHPYKTTGKIIVFCILIVVILDSRRQDKIF
jgi:hypothetical protein